MSSANIHSLVTHLCISTGDTLMRLYMTFSCVNLRFKTVQINLICFLWCGFYEVSDSNLYLLNQRPLSNVVVLYVLYEYLSGARWNLFPGLNEILGLLRGAEFIVKFYASIYRGIKHSQQLNTYVRPRQCPGSRWPDILWYGNGPTHAPENYSFPLSGQ